ncbi:MAG TPA: oligosaccharide flippase family protein [Puia sp.]|nr:oligosaccharide flippase family protein [Puia sp.]
MFLKKLFSHTLIYALGPQIPKLASIFVLPIVTKYLTVIDYGVYGIVTSYLGLLSGFSDLGFSVVMVNSFYQYPKKWQIVWRQLFFYLQLWSFVYAIIIFPIIFFTLPAEAKPNLWMIFLLNSLPAFLFTPSITMASRYYQYAQKPLFMSIVSAIVGVITLLLNLFTIAYLKMGYMGWFISTFVGTLVQFLFFFYPLFFKHKLYPILRFRKHFIIPKLKISLPIIPHNYSGYLLNVSDRVVLNTYHVPINKIGEYNLAYTYANYFDFFGSALGMAIGPLYNKFFVKKDKESESTIFSITLWLQISFLLIGFGISLWSKEVFSFLFSNPDFKTLYPLAILILMGYCYKPYYWFIISKFQFAEKTGQFWKISLVAGVLNLLLNLIFIPFYGIYASVFATFISLMYMGFAGFFLKTYHKLNVSKQPYRPLLVITVITALTGVAYLLRDVSLWVKIPISFISVAMFLIYSKKIKHIFYTIS